MTTQTATDELAPLAAFAWAALAEGRTNVLEAVDWVREESRCEDVAAVKAALYGAAATDFGERLSRYTDYFGIIDADWRRGKTLTAESCLLLSRGDFDTADEETNFITPDLRPEEMGSWRREFLVALALCRLIEAA